MLCIIKSHASTAISSTKSSISDIPQDHNHFPYTDQPKDQRCILQAGIPAPKLDAFPTRAIVSNHRLAPREIHFLSANQTLDLCRASVAYSLLSLSRHPECGVEELSGRRHFVGLACSCPRRGGSRRYHGSWALLGCRCMARRRSFWPQVRKMFVREVV